MKRILVAIKKSGKKAFTVTFWKQRRVIVACTVAVLVGVIGTTLLLMSRAEITNEILFPADANIVNVKMAPYNAKGDGITDDTLAIKQAILDNDADTAVFRSASKTVYIPKGTYLISDSIIANSSTVRVVGAGSEYTTIKLKDSATGFADTRTPKYVIKSGNYTEEGFIKEKDLANSGFANYFQDLTVDVGAGNPGAIGIRFDAANSGAMQRVTIKASPSSGKYGLAFETSGGPALVQDVTIEGFDYGVYFDNSSMNVLTLEDVTVRNQRSGGILNYSKNVVLENYTSENNPVGIRSLEAYGAVMVTGGKFTGLGTGPAIDMPVKGFLHLQDITTTGYSNIITVAGSTKFVGMTSLKEWGSENYRVGNTTKQWTETNDYVSLHLPIKEAPTYSSNDFSKWANIKSFGATAGLSTTDTANSDDDGPAIQKAIDSGAEVIYFPYGYYTISSEVVIRGNVKKIDFFFSRIDHSKLGGVFRVSDVNSNSVILENVTTNVIFKHNSSDNIVVRNANLSGGGIETDNLATGDLFVENTGSGTQLTINRPINVWARSIDRAGVDWTNNGGTLWVLSNNIESNLATDAGGDEASKLDRTTTTNGGKTEIFGGTLDSIKVIHSNSMGPVFQNENSFMSVFMPISLRTDATNSSSWDYLVHDVYSGGSTDLYASNLVDFPVSGIDDKLVLPLYVTPGYIHTTPPPPSADTTIPTVQITSPPQNAVVTGTVNINATASDNIAVSKVEFMVDGVLKSTDTSNPYSFSWDTNTVDGGLHSITAKAYDAADNSTSTAVSVTVQASDTTTPSAPTSLIAQATASNKVTLSWKASTDNVGVTGYWIIRNGVTIAQTGTTVSYTDTTVSASTNYSYQVRAMDAAGNASPSSNTATVSTPAAPDTSPPTVPGGLSASSISTSQINLAWSASTDNIGVASYDVYRNNVKIITVTTTSYGDTGLSASTTYSYHVIAKDATGNASAPSSTTSATTQTPPPVSATGTVKGVVSSVSGSTVPNAKVTFVPDSNISNKQIITADSVGKYSINGLAPGAYTVKYSGTNQGYISEIITINIPADGGIFTRNVILQKR